MMVETKAGIARKICEGARDFMLPPKTALPYRILTCISKTGEIVLVFGGTIAGWVTKNPTLIAEGALNFIPFGFNIRLDERIADRNTKKIKGNPSH